MDGPREPDSSEAAAFGLVLEFEPEPDFEVWPDNWPALMMFFELPWSGEGPARRPMYELLPMLMDAKSIGKKDRADMLADIRAAASVAADYWSR